MTWFSKSRDPEPVAPGRCARCRERPGTALVRFVAGSESAPLDRSSRTAWLCDACQDAVRRDAPGN